MDLLLLLVPKDSRELWIAHSYMYSIKFFIVYILISKHSLVITYFNILRSLKRYHHSPTHTKFHVFKTLQYLIVSCKTIIL